MGKRDNWLIYGATGYSGRHTAEKASSLGYRPVLAGRRPEAVRALAERLGLACDVLDLEDPAAAASALAKYSAVLNCAGPFLHTYKPMIAACVAAGTHYLDLTGEVEVMEALAGYDEPARRAGVIIMPAVGFDMVPGDCLAMLLQDRLPDATELVLGYSFSGTITRGSIRSALSSFSPDSLVRRGGRLERLPAPQARTFDFGVAVGAAECYSMTFGDVSIGWRSTKIPDVTAYLHLTEAFQKLASLTGEADILKLPEGPSDEELRTHRAVIYGEVRNAAGAVRVARLTTPQVYTITFDLAARISQLLHEGVETSGFQTPAKIFGKDFILGFEGCSLEWVEGR